MTTLYDDIEFVSYPRMRPRHNRSGYPQPSGPASEVKQMAKRVKGHRANKPNDSFGTVNDDKLYRGKHREDVDNDDEDEENPES